MQLVGNRGSGKTLAMVKALEANATVIVPNATLRGYVKQMIRSVRPDLNDTVRVVVIEQPSDTYRLMGLTNRIHVDHAFSLLAKDRVVQELEDHLRAMRVDWTWHG